jgi:HEAT repeats/PRC-barrel domain
MNIELHKNIECSDGPCGRIACIIVNPVNQHITHVVVKDRSRTSAERLVPIELVTSITHDSIQLGCTKKELARQESFEKKHFIIAAAHRYFTIPYMMHPYVMSKNMLVSETHERIPHSALAVRRGARVETTDGYAGKVDEFLIDPAQGTITHLLLKEGHFFGKKKINIPISQIDYIEKGTVYLKLNKHDLLALPAIPMSRCYIWHDAPVSERAAESDKKNVGHEAAVIKTLIKHLSGSNGLTRQYARKSLVAIGRPAVSYLLPLLHNPKHQIRWEAVKALGAIKDPSSIDGLTAALIDESFDVRWIAAEGLVELGRQVILPLLHSLAVQPGALFLRESAHHILRALIDAELEQGLKPVLAALEDLDPVKVRMATRSALKVLGKK